MAGFNELLAEANAEPETTDEETPATEPEETPDAPAKGDEPATDAPQEPEEAKKKDAGTSDEANPPQDEKPSKEGEEKPPEAPKSIQIDGEEVSVADIQKTYSQARAVVAKAKEVDKLEAAHKEALEKFPKDPFGFLREIYASAYGEDKADQIIDQITDDYKIKRFEWANKPDSERKAISLQAQLEKTQRELSERQKAETDAKYQAAVEENHKRILNEIAPHYKAEGLEEFREPGVIEPGQLIIDALKALHAAGEKADVAAVVKEVKAYFRKIHAGLQGKVTYQDLKGRDDIWEEKRKEDLAAAKEKRRAKTGQRPESAEPPQRDPGRPRLIPASQFNKIMSE